MKSEVIYNTNNNKSVENYLMLFLLFFLFNSIYAQEKTITVIPISTQKIDIDTFIGYDGLENLYYIKDNVFYKKKESQIWQYKNLSLGKITKIDIQNPLNIVLFYENFNTVVLLDNQLSESQILNFSKNSIPIIATAIGISSHNRLWVCNDITQQIGVFDFLKNTFQSLTTSMQGNITYYKSDFNTFIWIDEKLNWYSTDVYGKITDLGKLPDFDKIQMIDSQKILFSKGDKVYLQDFKNGTKYSIENVEKSFKKFYYKDQILSIFTYEGITNYKIILP